MTILTSPLALALLPARVFYNLTMNGDSANSTREARLARRRERYRERRAEETPEQREARLRRQRESDRGRRAQARNQETIVCRTIITSNSY